MKLVITSVYLVAIVCCVHSFSWSDCGGKDATVHFHNVSIDPEEPKLGEPLVVNAGIKVDSPIENGTISSLKVTKYVGIFGKLPLPILCIAGYGSCKSSLCEIFGYEKGSICQFLTNVGIKCDCPVPAGQYQSYDNKMITLPSTTGLQGLIAKGRYKVEWRWLTSEGKEFACFKGDIKLK